MSEPKTYTQADIDALKESIDKLTAKNEELVADVRKAKAEARAAREIDPETYRAEIERADKAEASLADANKALKTANTDRDKATKELESERNAARTFALEAEVAGAIAEGNVVPALVPAFKAMIAAQAKADLVDGKYAVTIGDKSARDHIKAFLDGDEGKAFRAADFNGGGGAPGSGGGKGGAVNPFAKDTFNMTEQAKLIKADPTAAAALAKAAGVTINI